MNLKEIFRKHQIVISILIVIAGCYMLFLGLMGVVFDQYAPGAILDMANAIGDWLYWVLVIGGFLTAVFSWYLVDRYLKIKEFNELMDTESKSKFIKNIARIENLAISLGPDYEDRVMKKEDEYNIDR